MRTILGDVASAAGGWATLGLFVLALGGTLLAAHRWTRRHIVSPLQAVPKIEQRMTTLEAEFSPNHGSSMRDSLDRNERMTTALARFVGMPMDELTDAGSTEIWICIIGALLGLVGLVLTLGPSSLWHWVEVHTGTVNEAGPYYGFFSGFGSDVGEVTLFFGIAAAYRHHNCHVKGCLFLGKPVTGTPYVACPKHHPHHRGDARGVSTDVIHQAATEVPR